MSLGGTISWKYPLLPPLVAELLRASDHAPLRESQSEWEHFEHFRSKKNYA